jgi:chromosome segregation ATPase
MDLFTIIAVVISVVSGVAGYVQARKAQKGSSEGILLTRADNNAGLYIIYGERRVGGIKVFKDVNNEAVVPSGSRTVIGLNSSSVDATRDHWSSNRIWLDRVDVLGQGPIHSVTGIEVDGDEYTHSRFAKDQLSHYRGIVMTGDSSQGYLSELGAKYSRWKSTSIGRDVAYVQSRFRNHQENVSYQGEPDVQYQVKGRFLWDPREDTNYGGTGSHDLSNPATWEWSDNPALALLDYLLADYGRNLDVTDIDIPSFIVAANSCDTLVDIPAQLTNTSTSTIERYNRSTGELETVEVDDPLPGYRTNQTGTQQKRLTCNIVIDPKDSVLDNVKKLLESMKGNLPYHQGKYFLKLEETASSVMSFDTSDIIGGISFGDGDQNERFNRVTVKFPNRNKRFVTDQVSWPQLDSADYTAYLAEDNDKELWHEVELEGITDFYQAEDIAEFIVRNSRASMRAEIRTKSKGLMLQPGDVIDITHPTPGWTAKKFRVRGVKMDQRFEVILSLGEYQDSVYQWSTKANEPDAPDVNIASPFDTLPAITNLAGTVTRVDSANGTPQGFVTLTWDAIDDFEVKDYVLRYKQQSETVFQTMTFPEVTRAEGETPSLSFVAPQANATYDVYLHYTVTSSGRTSAVVSTTVVIPEYRLDLDIELHDIELESGLSLVDENGDILNMSDLGDLALYYRNTELRIDGDVAALDTAVTAAETNVSNMQAQVNALNSTLDDLTLASADVYVQDDAPVAGVGGVPDPIPSNARWYDSNDNNHPYVWDGSAWVSLRDGTIGDNEAAITQLEADLSVAEGNISSTSAALSVLDTTVTNINNTVTSNSSDLVQLSSDLDAAEITIAGHTTSINANTTATSDLDTRVTAAEGSITTQSSQLTTLQSELDAAELGITANADATSALVTRVEANENALATVSAFDITTLQADYDQRTELLGEDGNDLQDEGGVDLELENDPSAIVAGASNATRLLEVRVEASEDSITTIANDITQLQADLQVAETGVAANASSIDGVTLRLTATEGETNANALDIEALEITVNNDTTGVLANANSISQVELDITDSVTGLEASASRLDALELTVNDPSTGVVANATAGTLLEARVTVNESEITSQSSDITTLQSDVTTLDGETTANATAIGGLDTRVTSAEGSITSQASAITTLQSDLSTAEGNITGNANAISGLDTRVTSAEGSITSQASSLTAVEANILPAVLLFSYYNPNGDVIPGLTTSAGALTLNYTPGSFDPDGSGYLHLKMAKFSSTAADFNLTYEGTSYDISEADTKTDTFWVTVPVTTGAGIGAKEIRIWSANATSGFLIGAVLTHGGYGDPQGMMIGEYNTSSASANASAISSLDTRVTSAEGSITSQATDITNLQSGLTTANGNITGNANAISGLDTRVTAAEGSITSQASDITTLQSDLSTANGNITGNANAISGIDTRVTAAEGSITSQATDITNLQSGLSTANGNITGNANAISGLDTRVTSAEGSITSQATDITNINSAITDPSTGLAANAAATQTLSTSVTANADGIADLEAEYNVRLDVNGNIAGFGLVNAGTSSEFNVLADKFTIVDPANPTDPSSSPFTVSSGTVTMQNVNIGGDLMVDGTITGGKIGNGEVNTTQITAHAVTDLDHAYTSGNSNQITTTTTVESLTMAVTSGVPVDIFCSLIVAKEDAQDNDRLATVSFDDSSTTQWSGQVNVFDPTGRVVSFGLVYLPTTTGNITFRLRVSSASFLTPMLASNRYIKAVTLKR